MVAHTVTWKSNWSISSEAELKTLVGAIVAIMCAVVYIATTGCYQRTHQHQNTREIALKNSSQKFNEREKAMKIIAGASCYCPFATIIAGPSTKLLSVSRLARAFYP